MTSSSPSPALAGIVEAGGGIPHVTAITSALGLDATNTNSLDRRLVLLALRGDIPAAHRLHGLVLSGWTARGTLVGEDGRSEITVAPGRPARGSKPTYGHPEVHSGRAEGPGVAWLAAILRARQDERRTSSPVDAA